jgi:Cu-processing system permease protein
MLRRIFAIMLNTHREAVRARILHGLLAVALATVGYAIVVGEFAVRSTLRVVSDLGSASISIFGILVAIVLAASSLYREVELKTIFPILARPIRRSEYLVGKYLGTLLTIAVFVAANTGVLLLALAVVGGLSLVKGVGVFVLGVVVGVVLAWRLPRLRTYVPALLGVYLVAVGFSLGEGVPDDRRVVVASSVLCLSEVAVVTAMAMVFAAFSSPFLTAIFTCALFVVGRSADTLAHLPASVFGQSIKGIGEVLSTFVPNLMLYQPPRSLLVGEATHTTLGVYLPAAFAHAAAWALGLLAFATLVFRRRDFH